MELIKFIFLVMMTKIIYLKMNAIGYHIFTNPVVDYTKIKFVEYRQLF